MKKSINIMLFVFAVCAFSSNMVFAANDYIPGVDIIVKKKPGDIALTSQTGRDGKFSFKLEEGNYELTFSYDQIKRILSGTDRNFASKPDGFEINLMFAGPMANVKIFDRRGNLVKAHGKLIINKETGAIKLTVAKGGGPLSGTLEYVDKAKSPGDQINQKR
ncbi:MAG: carboxypeptidase-like regulatory domain-containing protein [Leadbetterella sp.]|nr:carboxypeptidase-like regulatory domain-containing protein [Leadbetterella sp.]